MNIFKNLCLKFLSFLFLFPLLVCVCVCVCVCVWEREREREREREKEGEWGREKERKWLQAVRNKYGLLNCLFSPWNSELNIWSRLDSCFYICFQHQLYAMVLWPWVIMRASDIHYIHCFIREKDIHHHVAFWCLQSPAGQMNVANPVSSVQAWQECLAR